MKQRRTRMRTRVRGWLRLIRRQLGRRQSWLNSVIYPLYVVVGHWEVAANFNTVQVAQRRRV